MNLQYNVVCRKIAFCRDKKTSLHSIHQCVPAGRRIQELALLQTEHWTDRNLGNRLQWAVSHLLVQLYSAKRLSNGLRLIPHSYLIGCQDKCYLPLLRARSWVRAPSPKQESSDLSPGPGVTANTASPSPPAITRRRLPSGPAESATDIWLLWGLLRVWGRWRILWGLLRLQWVQ